MSKKKSEIIRLLYFLKPYKYKVILSFILLVVSTLLSIVPPIITKYAVDEFILKNKGEILWLVGLAIIGFGIIEGIISFLQQYISEYIGQNAILDIRSKLFFHVNKLSFSYFDKNNTGDIMSRIVSDTDTIKRFIGFGIVRIIVNIITIISIMVVLFSWSLELGLLYILFIPLMVHAIYKYSNKVRPIFSKIRKMNGKLTSYLQESFSGIKEIKLFGNEKFEINRFNNKNNSFYSFNVKSGKVTAFWMPYVEFLVGLSSGLVLLVGGILVINNEMTLGKLLGTLSYIGMLIRPIRQTGMMFSMYNASKASAQRIFELFDTKTNVKEKPNAKKLKKVKGFIEYKNVGFSYKNDSRVITDVNIKIEPNELVALVGPSGAGKTTLLHLLLRFYDVEKGEILIDGNNIKEYSIKSIRANIGIVMQNTFLFDGTIMDNISYGMKNVDFSKVKWASKIAQLDSFINQLPLKYKTPIGERGVKLSGGQAQRISVARVLVLDPKILVLDEPTSNVDAITDEKLMTALKKVTENRTTLVIAHRLSTIKNADKVIVVDEGTIKGIGTHKELYENNRYYNKLFSAQLKDSIIREDI